MKKILLTILIIGMTAIDSLAQLTEEQISQKVDSVMQTMTLTDKVGEMTQLAIDMVSTPGAEPDDLNEESLRNVFLNYRVGSILNVAGHAYTLDEWHSVIRQIQDVAIDEKPTGIPVIYGIDSVHGANYTMGSTLFP